MPSSSTCTGCAQQHVPKQMRASAEAKSSVHSTRLEFSFLKLKTLIPRLRLFVDGLAELSIQIQSYLDARRENARASLNTLKFVQLTRLTMITMTFNRENQRSARNKPRRLTLTFTFFLPVFLSRVPFLPITKDIRAYNYC